MATASSFDDQISCCLCLDVFKKPQVLFCGHSFCWKCLQDYINKNYENSDKQILCPLCRQNIEIPDSSKPVETWAAQFPVNIALVDSIDDRQRSKSSEEGGHISLLSSLSDNLKTFKEILQSQMEDRIEKLRQDVDISVVDTAEEVRRIGDTLISDFTAAVHKEQDRLIREIEKCQNFVNSEIDKLFTEHKHLIEENEKIIKLGEDLLQTNSEYETSINISKFTKLQNTTSKFLARSLSKIDNSEFKINLIKSGKERQMPVHIGEISTNIQTDTQTDRQTDILKHTDTISTKKQEDKFIPWPFYIVKQDELNPHLDSMLVTGEDKSKIVVSDSNNSCVKCFCLERKSLINKHVTSSPPCGLAESRDQNGVVVVAVPRKRKLLFLNLENFKLIKTIETDKQYWFVAVLPGNRLAVTLGFSMFSGQSLDILTDNGQLINSISTDLIPSPWFLTVHDQCLIVVSKRENANSLFCVTSSGDVKWESRDSERLRDLRGVTCDREGNIFVCEYDRNCVVQLSRDGNVLRDVLTDQDGLSSPVSVCCHGNKLFLGQRNGQIQIFTWSKK